MAARAGLPGAGDVLVFDNGADRSSGGKYSRILEITVPTTADGGYALSADGSYGPTLPTWTYVAPIPSTFFSNRMGGAQRLPNGNTILCNWGGHGHTSGPAVLEITPDKKLVWSLTPRIQNRVSSIQILDPEVMKQQPLR